MNRNWLIGLIVLGVLAACCLCFVVLGAAGALAYFGISTNNVFEQSEVIPDEPTATLRVIRPTRPAGTDAPLSPEGTEGADSPQVTPQPRSGTGASETAQEMYDQLEQVELPVSDLIGLAERLEGKQDIPATLPPPATPYAIGAQNEFSLLNTDSNQNFQVTATLRYITEHTYFWIEDGVEYNERELEDLAETFENKIYPTNRQFFGSEWTPGIDSDPHLYILYATNLGSSVAGYFASGDEFPPEASENSNGHEMFVFNADSVTLGEEYVYSTLAHEFQHMIHFNIDRNEELWMNEGFAELAAYINGYSIGGHDWVFALDPDLQLNTWAYADEEPSPHYGSAFLFIDYFLNRFGDEVTQALVASSENGMDSIDQLLESRGIQDPQSGQVIGADDVFADWAVTNYLLDENVGDGRFAYGNYPSAPRVEETETVQSCPSGVETRDVSQYGTDYIRIDCQGDYTLHFEGSVEVPAVPTQPHSGEYVFWTNRGDESNITLTQNFDFTNVSGPLTLSYWTWYDLEENYDYAYVEASTDGNTWQILNTPSGTDTDPTGNSYGWGYTGKSGDWIQEEVDLSQFAGQQVQLRFEYVTDAAVNHAGLLLDDISIPEINYSADFEGDDGGWQAEGFIRLYNVLPQTYELSIIKMGSDTTVERVTLTPDNLADISLSLGNEVEEVVLVVSGTTRFTREKTAYSYEIRP